MNLFTKSKPCSQCDSQKETKRDFCLECGKQTSFWYLSNGYSDYCSGSCASLGTREKSRQTCLEKYSVDNPSKSEKIKTKKEKKCEKNYGKKYFLQTKKGKENFKQTCLEKYGVDSPLQNKILQEKSRQTYKERTGYDI